MIVLDTSAIVAIGLGETEAQEFSRYIALCRAVVGTPNLLEYRMVLASRMEDAAAFMDDFLRSGEIEAAAFTVEMYGAAVAVFHRFGKGRGHRAALNFGDCMAYAVVAKQLDLPLLYKGEDFSFTGVRRVCPS